MSNDAVTRAATSRRKVVVIGAGFAGMAVVRELRGSDAEVTIVDRNNHHLFQPFLFQVATSILEPAEIAAPIRSLLNDMPNVRVEMREAKRIDLSRRVVVMGDGDDLHFDVLVVATGAQTSYFGHEAKWAQHALGLKTLPDALAARNRLLTAFERAEMESDPAKQARDMTVVVVGGGPTGVAITGTISEFVQRTLAADFRNIDPSRARIMLVQAGPRLLPAFSGKHSSYATRALERAGVEVRVGVPVTHVDAAGVTIGDEKIEAGTVLWCTGVRGVPLAQSLGVNVTATGTIAVENDFSVPGYPECFVVGDAAHVLGADGRPVPGLASIAQYQGRYVGKLIAARIEGSAPPAAPEPFVPSKLATITRHVGVAEFGGRSITGFPAWLMWGLLHLRTLAGGHSKLSILANWLRLLITYRRSARLVVEPTFNSGMSALVAGLRGLNTNEKTEQEYRRRENVMTLFSILALGFFLGMRHATDSDHVIAVTTIVSQQRKVGSAALTGVSWGIGHSITLLIVGATIVLFGVVIPERLGMGLEFCVAVMLVLLGLLNLVNSRGKQKEVHEHSPSHGFRLITRSVAVGVVHGLAGSAAVALLVLPMIREPIWAILYLLIFAAGTIAGMMLITAIIAVPITYSANRFQSFSRYVGAAAGAFSLAFGLFLVHQIGFVDGLLR